MLITGTFSWVYASSLHILSASHSHKEEMSSMYSLSHVTLRTFCTQCPFYRVPERQLSQKLYGTGSLEFVCFHPAVQLTVFDRTASKWSKFPADESFLRDKEDACRDKIKWTTCGTQFTARSGRCTVLCSTILHSNFVARFCNQTSLYASNSQQSVVQATFFI
jgi:hypothetical protein